MSGDVDVGEAAVKVQQGRSRFYPVAKRFLDVVVSFTLLLATAPLWILIAVSIKLDSPGPIIFRQKRIGLRGQEFTMYKFRSMATNADPNHHREAFQRYAEGEPLDHDEHGPLYKKLVDTRITRVGRVLRAINLDELPQLFNVLKGEMSIVGPRPAIPYELEWYENWYHQRFQVLPGITGLWQLSSRNRVGLEDTVRQDLEYIRRRSLLLDIKLMALTVPGMWLQPRRAKGAGGMNRD